MDEGKDRFATLCGGCLFNVTDCMCGREDFDHAIMDDFAFDDDNEREEDTKPKAEKELVSQGEGRRQTGLGEGYQLEH